MLTGVSVDRVGATAVILRRTATGYEPVTLGISSEYNGYGTIWSVNEGRNTELVYDFFATQYRSGRFMAKDQTYDGDYEMFTDNDGIEDLLSVIERTCSCWERYGNFYPPSTVLGGDAIVYAFVAQPIWDAVAGSASAAPTLEADFLRAFGDNTTAREIYDGHLPEVAEQVRQLAAVAEFVREHEMRWAPTGKQEHSIGNTATIRTAPRTGSRSSRLRGSTIAANRRSRRLSTCARTSFADGRTEAAVRSMS